MYCPPDYSGSHPSSLSPGDMPKTWGPEGVAVQHPPKRRLAPPRVAHAHHPCDRVGFMELMELRGGLHGGVFPGVASGGSFSGCLSSSRRPSPRTRRDSRAARKDRMVSELVTGHCTLPRLAHLCFTQAGCPHAGFAPTSTPCFSLLYLPV